MGRNDDLVGDVESIEEPVAPVPDATGSTPGLFIGEHHNIDYCEQDAPDPCRPLFPKQGSMDFSQGRSKGLIIVIAHNER